MEYQKVKDLLDNMIKKYREMINLLEKIKIDKEIPKERHISPSKKKKKKKGKKKKSKLLAK